MKAADAYKAPLVTIIGTGKGAFALGKKAKVHKELAARLVKRGAAEYEKKEAASK